MPIQILSNNKMEQLEHNDLHKTEQSTHHVYMQYIQLKFRRSVNARRTFSKFLQHLDKMHRYKICNAQRGAV
jgi:hypothetical protein